MATVRSGTRIAVIGAGLGGATAAAWLQREGCLVRLYEQARSFDRIGAGIHVSANVMKVLQRLGAEQQLNEIGIHPDIFTSRKWDSGEVLFELPLGEAGEQKYGASYITVHRHDLHAAILEKVEPGTIAFNRRLAKVNQDSKVVRLTFDDGSEAEADVVIGADGVNSKAMTQLPFRGGCSNNSGERVRADVLYHSRREDPPAATEAVSACSFERS